MFGTFLQEDVELVRTQRLQLLLRLVLLHQRHHVVGQRRRVGVTSAGTATCLYKVPASLLTRTTVERTLGKRNEGVGEEGRRLQKWKVLLRLLVKVLVPGVVQRAADCSSKYNSSKNQLSISRPCVRYLQGQVELVVANWLLSSPANGVSTL